MTGTAPTSFYTFSLHDALPISDVAPALQRVALEVVADLVAEHGGELRLVARAQQEAGPHLHHAVRRHHRVELRRRSEEHTSELQSRRDLVCRLLLEKKKQIARS